MVKLIKKKNITFLLSGGGSNLYQILKKNLTSKRFNVISIISNNLISKQIKELIKSNELEIKIYEKVSNLKTKFLGDCDVVFSVGYLKKINSEIIENYEIINLHPSLLPKYKGLNTHQRALDAGDKEHGVTVHFVSEDLDGGANIIQAVIPVLDDDNVTLLQQRVQQQEHIIYPIAVKWFIEGRLSMLKGDAYFDNQPLPESGLKLT